MAALEELGHFADVPMTIDVALDCGSLPLSRMVQLSAGTVIRSLRPAGDNVDIHAGGALIGYGEVVPLEGTMGVRITGLKEVL
jgi:flagellar motor switch protein FliN